MLTSFVCWMYKYLEFIGLINLFQSLICLWLFLPFYWSTCYLIVLPFFVLFRGLSLILLVCFNDQWKCFICSVFDLVWFINIIISSNWKCVCLVDQSKVIVKLFCLSFNETFSSFSFYLFNQNTNN